MSRLPSIYLAGPDVFLRDADRIGRLKKELCLEYGFLGMFPLDATPSEGTLDLAIYRANVSLLSESDLLIANLTPFRGPNADPGTAFELGLGIGLGKRVYAYTNVPTDLRERVSATSSVEWDAVTACWRDRDGMSVEDFGNADNLMLDCALVASGSRLVRGRSTGAGMYTDLTSFRQCLELAAKDRDATRPASPDRSS